MENFTATCRPVLFESGIEEYPYWGLGSSFFVQNGSNCYWLTAKHVMERQGQSFETLRVFPTDSSRMTVPFDTLYQINTHDGDTERADVYLLRVDLQAFGASTDAYLPTHKLTDDPAYVSSVAIGDDLVVVGYPERSRAVDYERCRIQLDRQTIHAKYSGPAAARYCHELQVKEGQSFGPYNGLSGGPVFRLVGTPVASTPKLIGMMLRGTAESRIGYFVGADVITRLTHGS